jgi:hypothetical protein
MGATPDEATGVVDIRWERGGEPPGDDADVRLDWACALSNKLKDADFDDGEEALLVRDRIGGEMAVPDCPPCCP